jgi:isoleucyl-tRNA synthetase
MKRAAEVIQGFDLLTVRRLEAGGEIEVCGRPVTLADILIERRERQGRVTETGGGVTVSLDIEVTPELKAEGHAREVKNRIQAMRKEAGLAVDDRIAVVVRAPEEMARDLAAHAAYLQAETLAVRLDLAPAPRSSASEGSPDFERTWDIDGQTIAIGIRRLPAP